MPACMLSVTVISVSSAKTLERFRGETDLNTRFAARRMYEMPSRTITGSGSKHSRKVGTNRF